MRINEVEKATGVPKKSIRFYESEGLLCPTREVGNDYRTYGEAEVQRLRQIKLLRRLAVPIESIRLLLSGSLTLHACMETHEAALARNITDLSHITALCRGIAEDGGSLPELDTAALERKMLELEQGGIRFMDAKQDTKRKKMVGPIIAAAVFVVLFGVFLGMVLWSASVEPVPLPFLIVMVLLFAAMIVGVLLALSQRIKEIQGGEEDEALHY